MNHTIYIVFILGILFSTVFALKNRTSDKIISGISVKGVDVSGLTIQEAKDKIYELDISNVIPNSNIISVQIGNGANGKIRNIWLEK